MPQPRAPRCLSASRLSDPAWRNGSSCSRPFDSICWLLSVRLYLLISRRRALAGPRTAASKEEDTSRIGAAPVTAASGPVSRNSSCVEDQSLQARFPDEQFFLHRLQQL